MAMPDRRPTVKEELHRLADELDDDATWDEASFQVAIRRHEAEAWVDEETYVAQLRETIERGRADSRAGRTFTTDEVRSRLGLPPL